jgi:hypothetical protein
MIETCSVRLTGYQAGDWLRDERHADIPPPTDPP